MRLIDADALKELFSEVIGHIAKKPEMNGNLEHMIRASAMVIQMIDDAPTVQPNTTTHDSIPAKTGGNDEDRTSSDCISRQAAIDTLRKMQTYKLFAGDDMLLIDQAEAQTELMMLPPAEPEQRWIPCSERQPDASGWYITTISGEICGQDRAFSGMSEFANGKWMSGDDVDETEMTIAWMPLPEPYQEEGEQE